MIILRVYLLKRNQRSRDLKNIMELRKGINVNDCYKRFAIGYVFGVGMMLFLSFFNVIEGSEYTIMSMLLFLIGYIIMGDLVLVKQKKQGLDL